MGKKTNKTQFVEKIATELGITKKAAAETVNAYEKVVKEVVAEEGDRLQLIGFLDIKKEMRAARRGRNPQTGEPMTIEAHVATKAKATF